LSSFYTREGRYANLACWPNWADLYIMEIRPLLLKQIKILSQKIFMAAAMEVIQEIILKNMSEKWFFRRKSKEVPDLQEKAFEKFLDKVSVFLVPDFLDSSRKELRDKLLELFRTTRSDGKEQAYRDRSKRTIDLFMRWLLVEKNIDEDIVESTCKPILMHIDEEKIVLDNGDDDE
jgi:hypothetical protein